jgi:Ca2+-binding RTX toxin-like protein
VVGPHDLAVEHVYRTEETYTIRVTARDKDGDVNSQATHTLTVLPLEMQDGSLVIGGTPGNDSIIVSAVDAAGTVDVRINGRNSGQYQPTDRILVYAQDGNDFVDLRSKRIRRDTISLNVPALIDAGAGNDTIRVRGSEANNILLGRDGRDQLTGGLGRDLLIGGLDKDTLRSQFGPDILIGGSTRHDDDLVALDAIMAEWGRTDVPLSIRRQHLDGSLAGGLNGSFLLGGDSVLDDEVFDNLLGDNQNWLFAEGKPKRRK